MRASPILLLISSLFILGTSTFKASADDFTDALRNHGSAEDNPFPADVTPASNDDQTSNTSAKGDRLPVSDPNSQFGQRFNTNIPPPPALFCATCVQDGMPTAECQARCGTSLAVPPTTVSSIPPAADHALPSPVAGGAAPRTGAGGAGPKTGGGGPASKPTSRTASKPQSSGDSNQDLQTCSQLAQQARNCCTNPSSCTQGLDSGGSMFQQPSSSQSLKGSCNQTGQANGAAGNNNTNAGKACYDRYSKCMEDCRGMAGQYPGDSNASSMQRIASSCSNLSSLADQLASQGLNNYGAQNSGQNCNQNTGGMTPQGMDPNGNPNSQANGANPNDPNNCQSNPTSAVCQNCAISPNSPTCLAAAQAQKDPQGKAGFQTASKDTGGNPNSFNAADMNTNAQAPIVAQSNQNGQAPQGHTIPNGGGQMPGGDQSSRPASLDQQRGGGAPGTPGYTTQIENGLMAGGYSGTPGGTLGTDGSGGYSYGRGGNNGGRSPASAGMDLKKYLPGQKFDPMNRMGGDAMVSAEINGKSCDMFKKISTRIQLKCKLGVLRDCH